MQSTQQQEQIHIKATFGQDIRRFKTEASFSILVDTLRSIYNLPTTTNLTIKFLDDEQDWITFGSDEELKHASELKLNPLKLSFEISTQQQQQQPVITSKIETGTCGDVEKEDEKKCCERRGRCHKGRRGSQERKWGELRGCHAGRRRRGSHEGNRGCHRGFGGCDGEEGKLRKEMCERRKELGCRFYHHRLHHDNKFEHDSTFSQTQRLTQRIDMIKSKIEKGVEDEKVLQFLTFRLAKLQWKLEHIQKFDKNKKKYYDNDESDTPTTWHEKILKLREEKCSIKQQLLSARKNEDKESILRLREALKSKKDAIRKFKLETFGNNGMECRRRRMFREFEPHHHHHDENLENLKHCKVSLHHVRVGRK